MDLTSLLVQKNNIFEHIFYEFSMYHQTYFMLIIIEDSDKTQIGDKQFWINVLLESHATHLRNLLHFFKGQDTINANTVLKKKPRLGICDVDKKIKIISQAISHLASERSNTSTGDSNLTLSMNELINSEFSDMCDRITQYLDILSNNLAIKDEYISEFKTSRIQDRYHELSNLYKGGNFKIPEWVTIGTTS